MVGHFALERSENFNSIYIYIYAFSRRFYPKRLTVHSGYTFFISMCVPWELNPRPFALLTQCSTTEPQEHEHRNSIVLKTDFADFSNFKWVYLKYISSISSIS